ncbi:MAG: hypothetical protein NOM71_00375 [Archaeoglobi archaeon]|nr:hypothetical protein [Archaeoglobi archaeon]
MQREVQICDMNIANALTGSAGWGSLVFELANDGKGAKPTLSAAGPALKGGIAHII